MRMQSPRRSSLFSVLLSASIFGKPFLERLPPRPILINCLVLHDFTCLRRQEGWPEVFVEFPPILAAGAHPFRIDEATESYSVCHGNLPLEPHANAAARESPHMATVPSGS